MVWAMTGKFSAEESSKNLATYVEDLLKKIEDRAVSGSEEEKSYILGAVTTMKASLRSLDTVYKGRELNFKENEKLRQAYLDSVKESYDFGNKAKDFLKSLPSMTLGAAGGVTIAQALGLSDVAIWGTGIGLAALGYLINLWFVRIARRRTQMLYVTQDYERGLYYDQYLVRVKDILLGLYLDLERIHMREFHENYETDTTPGAISGFIDNIMSGVASTFCKFVHDHMGQKKITPELWSMCESGNQEAVKRCKYWER
jgi:hypothetical protein